MSETLFESEYKVMEILWEAGSLPAKEASRIAAARLGWNKNTTYTVLTKLVAKGVLRREDPGFLCTPLITREEARRFAAKELVRKTFGGSRRALFSSLLEEEALSDEERDALLRLIEKR